MISVHFVPTIDFDHRNIGLIFGTSLTVSQPIQHTTADGGGSTANIRTDTSHLEYNHHENKCQQDASKSTTGPHPGTHKLHTRPLSPHWTPVRDFHGTNYFWDNNEIILINKKEVVETTFMTDYDSDCSRIINYWHTKKKLINKRTFLW